MVVIDPFVAYGICGVSSLAGGSLLLLVRPEDTRLAQAVRHCAWGLMLIGLALGQLLWADGALHPLAEALLLAGPMVAVPLIVVTFGILGGAPWARPKRLHRLALACGAVQIAAMALPAPAAGLANSLLGSAGALLLAAAAWPMLVRPRHPAERALALSTLLYAMSWGPRSVGVFTWSGPPPAHHVYVSADWQPIYGLLYATLPVTMSALVLSVVVMRLHQQLHQRASIDDLTGTLLRRALREQAPMQLASSRRTGRQTAVLMVDIDHFKRINDTLGHPAGDEVLRHTAQVLRAHLRPDALLSRHGGEEFVVVLPVVDLATARSVAERLRHAIASTPCPLPEAAPVSVTASLGLAMLGEQAGQPEPLESALNRADQALYAAKRGGRDRIELAPMAALPA
jgi:diguanylate cyclase (GGDEF)-like protein